jgi:hypothetical protein
MTFIELSVFLFRLGLSLGSGMLGYKMGGIFTGAFSGCVVFLIFPYVTSAFINRFASKGRGIPACPNMICSSDDYTWIEEHNTFPVCQCKCGIKLVLRGDSFDILESDRRTIPYKKWDKQMGWIDIK